MNLASQAGIGGPQGASASSAGASGGPTVPRPECPKRQEEIKQLNGQLKDANDRVQNAQTNVNKLAIDGDELKKKLADEQARVTRRDEDIVRLDTEKAQINALLTRSREQSRARPASESVRLSSPCGDEQRVRDAVLVSGASGGRYSRLKAVGVGRVDRDLQGVKLRALEVEEGGSSDQLRGPHAF